MENNNTGTKKYHQNRITLQQVENNLFNGDQQTAYYFINRTPLTGMEKFVINYILNFTQNGKPCHTPYKKIAFAGGYKVQSIEPCISKLTKMGLIIKGKQVSNKDNKGSYIEGGLSVDLPSLILLHKEYNDTHNYEALEAEYKIYQQAKKSKGIAKRDAELAAKDEEIDKLKKLLARQSTPTEISDTDQLVNIIEEEVVSESTLDANTTCGSVEEELMVDITNTTPLVDFDREPTEEELELINNNKPIQVIYEEMANYARNFNSIPDAVASMKGDRPNLTPLKMLLALNEGLNVEPKLQFRYKEDSQPYTLNKSA